MTAVIACAVGEHVFLGCLIGVFVMAIGWWRSI